VARRRVWFVDDLPENLASFEAAYGRVFEVTTFSSPREAREALERKTRPDALLCDIFFYDSTEQAVHIEQEVGKKAEELRRFAHETLKADEPRFLQGIDLIADVMERFRGAPPFPVYAYTSKGPYILQREAWDRISDLKARILLKKRSSDLALQRRLISDIDEYQAKRVPKLVVRYFKELFVAAGFLGYAVAKLLDWVLAHAV
jgi:CheY-like chemotaxis protein